MIRNVSENGVGGTAPVRPLRHGESVTIVFFDDLMVEGVVAWVDGEKFGVQLRNNLDLSILTDMIRRKRESAATEVDWEVRRIHKVQTPVPQQGALRRV